MKLSRKPLSAPAWWQFEWLAGLGVLLSALPCLGIFKLDAFFAANESLRYPVAGLLILIEVTWICFSIYRLVAAADRAAAKARHRRHVS